jgi:hypothetical protein
VAPWFEAIELPVPDHRPSCLARWHGITAGRVLDDVVEQRETDQVREGGGYVVLRDLERLGKSRDQHGFEVRSRDAGSAWVAVAASSNTPTWRE